MAIATTTIIVSNLHCNSCVNTIREALYLLSPAPLAVETSIISQTVSVEHSFELAEDKIRRALDEAGFDLVSTLQPESYLIRTLPLHLSDVPKGKKEKHTAQCLLCQQEEYTTSYPMASQSQLVRQAATRNVLEPSDEEDLKASTQIGSMSTPSSEGPFNIELSVGGMTCVACVVAITQIASDIPGVTNVAVSLIGKSATATINRKDIVGTLVEGIEDGGYECELINIAPVKLEPKSRIPRIAKGPFVATFSVGGMTCAACVVNISQAASAIPGVTDVAVNLVGHSASATLESKELVDAVIEAIEDGGYEAQLASIAPVARGDDEAESSGPRTVSLRVDGMFSQHCPEKIVKALSEFGDKISIDEPIKSFTDPKPVMRLTYTPAPPEFTLRQISSAIASAKSPPFVVTVAKPPSLEERARELHASEQLALLRRLISAVIIAIPTFIIGIVFMTLVPKTNPTRMWFMHPIWVGNASRGQWAMFLLATPVMFYSAGQFHRRSLKEIHVLWRRGSRTPVWKRFVRFGSMNLLVSMGVSIAYFSSIALLALAAAQAPSPNGVGDSTTYFDSVVFLCMFLLAGRLLEAYSKGRTADAVSALGRLRPSEALLLVPMDEEKTQDTHSNPDSAVDLEKGLDESAEESFVSEKPGIRVQRVNVDFLETGDIVRVPHGSTPPADGTIVSADGSQFDESSLTGESRPIKKNVGDQVFVGTINRGKVVEVKISKLGGETMLDQIVKVVREGQTRRAPIERLADLLTGYFVPVITALALLTWTVWLGLGLSGALPQSFLDIPIGGWPVWALEFAIAVFVVACPCGIGLAAPTALLVGSGLAAKFGILVRGGGEAFQEAAQLDLIVFDKTGTLTQGGEPQITDAEFDVDGKAWSLEVILAVVLELESASSHPLGIAVRNFCESRAVAHLGATGTASIEEIPGCGIKGSFLEPRCSAIVGNEKWLREHGASVSVPQERLLEQWKSEGKSVIIFAMQDTSSHSNSSAYVVLAMFAAADQLRPEACDTVKALQKQGLGTWMISGDNPTTAKAVAKMVGIHESNVIAGVLPHQKAEKISWLQQVGRKRETSNWRRRLGLKRLNERCIVAMVGDGINDAPALTTADVGIAIGSGSDIAISSASFILIKSNLQSILTLTDLSRKVFDRIKFNFLWAVMYNIAALPIAAGVIYPAGHARLDPVWASLAMALSSTTVVSSSLLLRLYREPKLNSTKETNNAN